MIIKSVFKDYYDYLCHVYGVDEKIAYDRSPRVCPLEINRHGFDDIWPASSNFGFWNLDTGYNLKYVAITGVLYIIAQKKTTDTWFYVKPEQYGSVVINSERNTAKRIATALVKGHGFTSPSIVKLHKLVDSPVFSFEAFDRVLVIDARAPNLGQLGIPAIIPAEQMYQNICHYLTNVLRDSPDSSPVSPMTDQQKVVSHGFDKIQSFRHRV